MIEKPRKITTRQKKKTGIVNKEITTTPAENANATPPEPLFQKSSLLSRPVITAEVNNGGAWQKVTIVDKESEYLYKVHYTGQNDSADEWVSLGQLKNIDSTPIPDIAAISLPKETVAMNAVVNCSFKAPVGAVQNIEKFSEKVAKRKVYEWLVQKNKSASKIGVTYLFYQTGHLYTNTVHVSETKGLLLKNANAPAGALVYPVRMKYRFCEQIADKTFTQIIDGNFSCYRNSKGFWECSGD